MVGGQRRDRHLADQNAAPAFEADRTGLDRALGTGVSIVGGVLLLTIIAGIYRLLEGRRQAPPNRPVLGGFPGHHLTPWLLLAQRWSSVFFLYSPTIGTMRMSNCSDTLDPRRPFAASTTTPR